MVRAVARGLSNAEIGRELAMGEGTVKAHVSRALAKLGLSNRVQMALLVRDAGMKQCSRGSEREVAAGPFPPGPGARAAKGGG